MIADGEIAGGDAGTDKSGRVEAQRLAYGPLGELKSFEHGFVEWGRRRIGWTEHEIRLGAEPLPHTWFEAGSPHQPGEGGGGGVVPGPDERVDLITDLGVAQSAVRGDDFEDVERVADGVGATVGDFFVDDVVDLPPVGTDTCTRAVNGNGCGSCLTAGASMKPWAR